MNVISLFLSVGMIACWIAFFSIKNITLIQSVVLIVANLAMHICVVAIEFIRKQHVVWVLGTLSFILFYCVGFRLNLSNTFDVVSGIVLLLFYIFAILNSATHVVEGSKVLKKITKTHKM